MNLKALAYQLRRDTIDIICAGKAGHIGGDMSVMEILVELYFDQMNIDAKNPEDPDRDLFVLSKGHSMEAYYAVLSEKGFLDKEDVLKNFSQFGSKYIGHPNNKLPGIEMNSGSLGHGLPVCVGMAKAAKMDHKDRRVYVVMGDGELAEGSVWEGAMAARQYKLDNLCAVVDRNRLQISGNTEDVMGHDDLHERFRSFGWHVIDVKDGNDIDELHAAFEEAKCVKANKQMICEVLMEAAKEDQDIVALCSDSRGSGSFTPFADTYPEQFVETGIAEQNLVSIAAGLAKCGKKSYAVSPACFLSTRSYEQCKVDVAYSNTNVKLIGISGGISYGALGMSHHSAQDIAAMSAIPNMRVYIPSDHVQTRELTKALLKDEKPAYIRVGRNAVDPIYEEENVPFEMDHATVVTEGNPDGNDVAIIACGEMVKPAKDAAEILKSEGILASVLDMYCIKPLDEKAIVRAAENAKAVITVEEHAPFGGLGSMVAQVTGRECPKKVVNMSLPDAPVITGTSKEVFDYYGLNAEGIVNKAKEILK